MTILKGLLIGMCASAPLGPVGILIMQKSLCHGFKTGFVTGLGAALTDAIYAIIAVFFLAITQDFLARNEELILIIGGVVVAALGVNMALKNPFRKICAEDNTVQQTFSMSGFFEAFLICITNPGAILIMFSLFTAFGVDVEPDSPNILPLLLAVSGGCVIWWFAFAALFGVWSKRIKVQAFIWINRVFGLLLIIIGLALLAGGVFRQVF